MTLPQDELKQPLPIPLPGVPEPDVELQGAVSALPSRTSRVGSGGFTGPAGSAVMPACSSSISAMHLPDGLQAHDKRNRTITDHVRDFFSLPLILTMVVTLALTWAHYEETVGPRFTYKGREVAAWKPYVVGNIIAWGVVLMVTGFRADFVLFGELCIFGLFGIVTKEKALEGFASDGNLTGSALLFVVAGAIEHAGILDQFALAVLGQPKSMASALLRITIPGMIAAGFLNSPAVATVLTPLVTSWARRLSMDERALLMPMGIALSFGGSLSLIGCGPALIAKDIFSKSLNIDIGMFDITPVAVILCLLYFAYVFTIGKFVTPSKSGFDESGAAATDDGEEPAGSRYLMQVLVNDGCLLIGSTIAGVGLNSIPGAAVERACNRDDEEARVEGDQVGLWVLRADDVLTFRMTADGAAAVRKIKGMEVADAAVHCANLGPRRRRRGLMEVVVSPWSWLLGKSVRNLQDTTDYLVATNSALLAARRPGSESCETLQPGDVLLVEAAGGYAKNPEAGQHFSLVSEVPNSRTMLHKRQDLLRGYFILVLLLSFIVLSFFKVADLVFLVILLCGICVMTGAMTPEDTWGAAKGSVFLVISAAFGIGNALELSGLASCIANGVLHLVGTSSVFGVMCALGFVTSLLSNLMSNTATCVLMSPIAHQIIEGAGFHGYAKAIVYMLIYSANASFSTPIATPPNLIISTSGANFTWGEFLKFGLPLQMIVLPFTAKVLMMLYGS